MTPEQQRILGRQPHAPTDALKGFFDVHARFARGTQHFTNGQVDFLRAVLDAATIAPSANGAVGVLGMLPCGGGKTVAIQAAATLHERPLLITRKPLIKEAAKERAKWEDAFAMKPHFLPADVLMGREGTDTLYFATYGKLSRTSGVDALDALAPDAIFLDEAHLLGKAGRREHLWRHIARRRHVRVYALSGSLMNRSIFDFATVGALALRHLTPFPLDGDELALWATMLDEGGEPDAACHRYWAPIAQHTGESNPRKAFQELLHSTRCVVAPKALLDTGVSLAFQTINPREGESTEAAQAIRNLDADWVAPGPRPIVDALDYWSTRQQLSLGYYTDWPDDVPETFREFFEARREWSRYVRQAVKYRDIGDIPSAVEANAARLSRPAREAYARWCAVRNNPPPPRATHWLSHHVADTVVDWVHTHKGVKHLAVWVKHWAIALTVYDALVAAGADAKVYGPNNKPDDNLAHVCILTHAHSEGWNGQAIHRALVVEPPTTPRGLEQLISRHHRNGQNEDVTITFLVEKHTPGRWRKEAKAVQDTLRAPLRILLGDWE